MQQKDTSSQNLQPETISIHERLDEYQIPPIPQVSRTNGNMPRQSMKPQQKLNSITRLKVIKPRNPNDAKNISDVSHVEIIKKSTFADTGPRKRIKKEVNIRQRPRPGIEVHGRYASMDRYDMTPRSSIPHDISHERLAAQCIEAAFASRLSPYALHTKETAILKHHLNHDQVTVYLNIRNRILRLWQRNPLVSVTREEAAGCARDFRFIDLADIAYEWLVRNGYINFGCVETPCPGILPTQTDRKRNIVIIGGGVAGLGAARQIEGLLSQFSDRFVNPVDIPNVILLEARERLGGRIYSQPLKTRSTSNVISPSIDLGGQIITGFEGNPVAVIFRGQLGLPYHMLHDKMLFYDIDGSVVDRDCDMRCEKMHNDVLDRVSIFKHIEPPMKLIEGKKQLIDTGKDPASELIAKIEEEQVDLSSLPLTHRSNGSPYSANVDKLTGKATTATGSSAEIPAYQQVQNLGWKLRKSHGHLEAFHLDKKKDIEGHHVLGKTMDAIIDQYRDLVELTPQDFRVLNWHIANLEYANAAKLDCLSLEHWDQDDGNEFSGGHAMLIGGYSQLAKGIYAAPTQLDARVGHIVSKISHKNGCGNAVIECTNGTTINADKVIVTIPLGVLKDKSVIFEPDLPLNKSDAIKRLGFGLLNKVVLVYENAFWDIDNDMIGQLREPDGNDREQCGYENNRGRFYMFWNCIKVTGLPVLVALMAGEAAYQTEVETDAELIREATQLLKKNFPDKEVPLPVESVITRWMADPFSKGTYSYVAPGSSGDDYDEIAKPIDDVLFFAGEATCKNHPATVHGAYISGLRAAAEVVDSILGPIQTKPPSTLHTIKSEEGYAKVSKKKRSIDQLQVNAKSKNNVTSVKIEDDEMIIDMHKEIGQKPVKPGRAGSNPFLLYQKDYWLICKDKCDRSYQAETGEPNARASRNQVRAALGLMWREAPEHIKAPYLEECAINKASYNIATTGYNKLAREWDAAAEKFKKEWIKQKPDGTVQESAHSAPLEPPAKKAKKDKKKKVDSNA